MNKKKSIAVAIVLLLILLIGGMLAYFTDTDTKENVFTLGKDIDIELLETAWDTTDTNSNNVPDAAEGIHPGTTLQKDPVIKNKDGKAPAYVFAEVIVPCYDQGYTTGAVTVDEELFTLNDLTGAGWTLLEAKQINQSTRTKTYIYYYGNPTDGMTVLQPNTSTSALFSSITLKSSLTAAEAATAIADPAVNPEVKVNAYAIQTDGFAANSTPSQIFGFYKTQNP